MKHFLRAFLFTLCLPFLVAGPGQQMLLAVKTAGGGGGGPTLVANIKGSGSDTSDTTSAITTTTSNFIVIAVSNYVGSTSVVVTDSKLNTWTALTEQTSGEPKTRLWYCYSPTVGTGHTFTATAAGGFYGTIYVQAWAGIAASPFDQQNGNFDNAAASTIPTGSVTPSQANELIITALGFNANSSGAITIDSSFTITDTMPQTGGVTEGGSMAYKVVSSTSAVNPTWNTTNNANNRVAVIATFKY